MSTTTQFTTFEDLYLGLQKSVRVTTGISATTEQAKAYINTACHDFHIGYDYKFPWCERHSTLIVQAPYTTGTLSVAAGSTSLTGSGTAWNTNNTYGVKNMRIGGKLTIAGGTDIYRISAAPGSDTSGTIGTRYVASSDASGAEYRYFEDEYALASDFLRPVDFRSFTSAFNIPVIDRNEWRRRYSRPNIAGKPKVCCIIEDGFNGSTTPVRKIAFFPYPDAAYIFPYAYITNAIGVDSSGANLTSMSATTDEPIVPLRYRHVIHLKALARWYRDKRDDVRADSVLAEYVDLATRIVNDMDIGTTNKAQIRPSGGYWQAARKPYGMRTGRKIYDLNDEWDSFRR